VDCPDVSEFVFVLVLPEETPAVKVAVSLAKINPADNLSETEAERVKVFEFVSVFTIEFVMAFV
jgi:hypothetical protein